MNILTLLKSRSIYGPVLALGLLAGCDRSQTNASSTTTTTTAAVATTAPAEPAEMYADAPPPLPQSEVMVASPGPDYVWVGGYWGWQAGNTHSWVRGHWERPPHPHATWEAPRWEHRGQRYVFHRGSWR